MRLKLAAALVGASALVGCTGSLGDGHPSDQQVLEAFAHQRVEFESLASQAANDPGAISNLEFRKRARKLGVELAQAWGGPLLPEVRFVLSSEGGAIHGSSKGLAYSRRDLTPQLASLDGDVVNPDTEGFRRIDEGWHIYLSR